MPIDVETLQHADMLCEKHKREGRSYRITLHALGLEVRGYDRTNLANFLSWSQIIPWSMLEMPSVPACVMLEEKFARMDREVEDRLIPVTQATLATQAVAKAAGDHRRRAVKR